jgi:hypothetical protein
MSLRAASCWEDMAISPPRSPEQAAPSSPSTLPPLNVGRSARAPLQTAIQTFLVEEQDLAAAAYVLFEETQRVCLVSQQHGVERINRQAVIPYLVVADRVETGSVTSPEGEEGWLFVLLEDETKVATVEVYSDRLVLVHASFSRDAVNAGSVPPATRLVFTHDHCARVREAMQDVDVDEELTYIPTTEVLWSPRARRLFASGGSEGRVWEKVCEFLEGMNPTVVAAIERHNSREFATARVPPGELPVVCLSAIFGR